MKKILVPVDFSKNSLSALHYGADLASIFKSQLIVLHVSILPVYYINDINNYIFYKQDYENSIKNLNKLAEAKLNEITNDKLFKSIAIKKESLLSYGVHNEIVKYADKNKIDLIIMGSKNTQNKSFFNIGSNTERVIRSSNVSVLVIRKDNLPSKIKKVVFASDFEKDSYKIFPFLNEFIKPFNSQINLLYINTKSEFKEYDEIKNKVSKFQKKFTGNFKTVIRAANNVDEGIVKYSKAIKADLIAIGQKNRGAISLFLSDRITEGVLNATEIPVLAIDNPRN